MALETKKIILFDFDGVIIDSINISYEINKEDIVDLEISEWKSWFEGNVYTAIRNELKNDEYINGYFKKYSERIKGLLPVKGMRKVFEKLVSEKYKLIIVSSSAEKPIKLFLKNNKLEKYFTKVMGKESHRSKVEKFRMVFEKYKINPNETLIVTDTIGDVKEAKEVGMKTIGVGWGVHPAERLKEAQTDFIAERAEDVITGVEKLLALN